MSVSYKAMQNRYKKLKVTFLIYVYSLRMHIVTEICIDYAVNQ